MDPLASFSDFGNYFSVLIILITFWDLIWRGVALWHAAGEKRKYWFVALLLVNSVGLLPIIYFYYFRKSSVIDKNRVVKLIVLGIISVTFIVLMLQTVINTMVAQSLVDDTPQVVIRQYTDTNLKITSPLINTKISSPLEVTGQARGTWFFEADFPIRLFDANGNELTVGIAQAQGDWMTEEFVPFTATLEFQTPTTKTGYLILEKNNPSDLPENAAEVKILVKF